MCDQAPRKRRRHSLGRPPRATSRCTASSSAVARRRRRSNQRRTTPPTHALARATVKQPRRRMHEGNWPSFAVQWVGRPARSHANETCIEHDCGRLLAIFTCVVPRRPVACNTLDRRRNASLAPDRPTGTRPRAQRSSRSAPCAHARRQTAAADAHARKNLHCQSRSATLSSSSRVVSPSVTFDASSTRRRWAGRNPRRRPRRQRSRCVPRCDVHGASHGTPRRSVRARDRRVARRARATQGARRRRRCRRRSAAVTDDRRARFRLALTVAQCQRNVTSFLYARSATSP